MLRWLTAGESHGPELVAILEGLPAGVPVSLDGIRADLARRLDQLLLALRLRSRLELDGLEGSHGLRPGDPR